MLCYKVYSTFPTIASFTLLSHLFPFYNFFTFFISYSDSVAMSPLSIRRSVLISFVELFGTAVVKAMFKFLELPDYRFLELVAIAAAPAAKEIM